MNTNTAHIKRQKKQQRYDRQRILRVVEYLDYSAIFDNCPVEITEGYVVSDVEDYKIFASFVFRNVSKKGISALDIRLLLYKNQNIPYLKIPFVYSYDSYTFGTRRKGGERIRDKNLLRYPVIRPAESFGETIYVPIPESYFTKFELEITGVKYSDGSYKKLEVIAGKSKDRYFGLDDEKKYVYQRKNIYISAEELHPTRFIPKKGEYAWLCCCGHKNIADADKCEVCFRERDWQLENINKEKLGKDVIEYNKVESTNFCHDKTKYSQLKYMQTDEEIEQKIKNYELAMKNVAALERKKERVKIWLIPKLALFFAIVYILSRILEIIYVHFIKTTQ